MIINKNTSDSRLVNSLVITGDRGKPISGVLEFDSSTLTASLDVGGTVVALSYWFVASDEASWLELQDLLINAEADPERAFYGSRENTKKAMIVDTLPADVLRIQAGVGIVSCMCSNCETMFVVGVQDTKIFKLAKPNAADVLFTLTELDPTNLVCDNCGVPVSITT